MGLIKVSRCVKDFITFEISIQQMVRPLSSAPLFSELTHKKIMLRFRLRAGNFNLLPSPSPTLQPSLLPQPQLCKLPNPLPSLPLSGSC